MFYKTPYPVLLNQYAGIIEPVGSWITVMVAPGITPPFSSFTAPCNVAVVSWANAFPEIRINNAVSNFLVFMLLDFMQKDDKHVMAS